MLTDPRKNVTEFGFIPSNKVADLGSGAGHYSFALSDVIGDTGMLYAVDINKEALIKLKQDFTKERRENIEIVWGDIEEVGGTRLKDGLVDGAVLTNIFSQLKNPSGAVAEAKRIVKTGGKVCVVEWLERSPVKEADAKNLFASAQLTFERAFDAGENHYGLIFKKPLQ